MYFSKTLTISAACAAMILAGCTRGTQTTYQSPQPAVDSPATPGQPVAGQPNPVVDDGDNGSSVTIAGESSVTLAFPEKAVADYGLNTDSLFYSAKFISESGNALVTISRTKLEFDDATDTAKVVMKVKRGSRGHITMEVEDTTDGAKYEGKSQTITVTDDTTANVELKKAGDTNTGDDDAGLTITIDRDALNNLGNDRNNQDDDQNNNDDQNDDDQDNDDQNNDDDQDNDQNNVNEISYKRYSGTVSQQQLAAWREADQAKRGADARYWKYSYVDSEFYADENNANIARVGIFKALNHVAINNTEIFTGEEASEGYGILFAFDIRKFLGPDAATAERKWSIVSRADRRAKSGMISAPAGNRLRAFGNADLVPASRLVFNLTFPDIYNQLIDTPAYERNLLRAEGIPFNEAEAWTAQKDAIVFGSRVTALRRADDGRAYWATADDFDGREGNPIPHLSRYRIAPQFRRGPQGMVGRPDAGTIASEAWIEMKNGLIAYYIWGNAGQERGRAELFVIDPRNIAVRYGHKYLETGRSCITCHVAGVQAAPSDIATAVENGTLTGSRAEEAKRYWTTNEKLSELYSETSDKFASSMTKIVNAVSDGNATFNREIVVGAQKEPVLLLVEKIDGGVR